jgi:phenylpropionate dioxygenase-like ring-hydroxylating dioxygenase large terminal subunit
MPDSVALNEWHVVAALADLPIGRPYRTCLLLTGLVLTRLAQGGVEARVEAGGDGVLPVRLRFGFVWTTLGAPAHDIFAIAEYDEPDRRNLSAGSMGVHASAPRAIENFLDLGHLPIVHAPYLGTPSQAAIAPYRTEVSVETGEVVASLCRVYQPKSSLAAAGGIVVEYSYRVPHPYCAVLYKSSAIAPARSDVIALLVQPVAPERSIAHMLTSLLDDSNSDHAIRGFQQMIFAQDKPILENQLPKRLPLDPKAERAIRVDASSVAYRRWLRARGVTFGTLA